MVFMDNDKIIEELFKLKKEKLKLDELTNDEYFNRYKNWRICELKQLQKLWLNENRDY